MRRRSLGIVTLLLLSFAILPPCQAPAGKKGAMPPGAGLKTAPEKAWQNLELPAPLTVEQTVKNAPGGWTVAYEDRPCVLAGVTFYAGPPEKMASLVYDTQKTVGRKWVATWVFDPEEPGGTWVEFHFAGTTAMLRNRLPAGVSAAEVTCDRDQHIDGYEQLLSIRIR